MRHSGGIGRAVRLRNLATTLLAAALATCLIAGAARADYTQLTQTRSLNTSGSAEVFNMPVATDADSETSDALGSFDRSINSGAGTFNNLPNPPFFANGSGGGTARQSVQFAPTSITASFGATASASTIVAQGSGSAASTWSTTFRVDQPTPVELNGLMSAQDSSRFNAFTSYTYGASLGLSRHADGGGPEQSVYNVALQNFPLAGLTTSRPIDFTGVLEPGYVYTLSTDASAGRSNNSTFISASVGADTIIDVHFTLSTVPEPAAAGALALSAGLLLRRRRA